MSVDASGAVPNLTLVPDNRLVFSAQLADSLLRWAKAEGLAALSVTDVLMTLSESLITAPAAARTEPPEFVSEVATKEVLPRVPSPVRGTHSFFDVIAGRKSRRDFGVKPLDQARLLSLMEFSFGARGTVMAYNFRGVPVRYVPSAGGLNSVECYLIVSNVEGLEPGSYLFDGYEGVRLIARGGMIDRLAVSGAGSEWIGGASFVAVLVSNLDRLNWKYTSMSHKLALLDVGVAAGHLCLVATALELRSCIVGNVDAGLLAEMLRLDPLRQRPVASVVVGTRGSAWVS